jgi:hypothetical protein
LHRLLGLPPLVTAPTPDAENDEDASGNKIMTVAIPQLFEPFAPNFLVNFMKNIGHDGSKPAPLGPTGPDWAVN